MKLFSAHSLDHSTRCDGVSGCSSAGSDDTYVRGRWVRMHSTSVTASLVLQGSQNLKLMPIFDKTEKKYKKIWALIRFMPINDSICKHKLIAL